MVGEVDQWRLNGDGKRKICCVYPREVNKKARLGRCVCKKLICSDRGTQRVLRTVSIIPNAIHFKTQFAERDER